ncbi:type II toxin-antitoxin system RelE/ParE family toxin [bacterium]|nr:type II toxin-antitoxin system RelE/ParE family toxin [bacterium]
MKYRVRISKKAVSDVIRNANWWAARYSEEQAIIWEEEIFLKMSSLDGFPESHPLAYENPDFPYELREAHFGLGSRPGYRILFTIEDDVVNIVTVRAAQEDRIRPEELE